MTAGRDFQGWLDHQLGLHPRGIDLGLERVRVVAERLLEGRPAETVITVAGTNGKGSTVAYLEALALAHGVRVGCYTSPHLFRYGERLRVNGVESAEEAWLPAFAAVEAARGEVSLSFFEFGTLAVLWLMQRQDLDLAVLEVGLGGRLDAVNIIDCDAAIITSIGLDHQDYLGDTIEKIAAEKAGIMRAGKPAIIAAREGREVLLECARRCGASPTLVGRDFGFAPDVVGRRWQATASETELDTLAGTSGTQGAKRSALDSLSLESLAMDMPCQWDNVAAALAAWQELDLPLDSSIVSSSLACVRVPGRLQQISDRPRVVVDVAHNPAAAEALGRWVSNQRNTVRSVRAVFGALRDKDSLGMVQALIADVDYWYGGGLSSEEPRAMSADELRSRHSGQLQARKCSWAPSVCQALEQAKADAEENDLIVVFGSFAVVRAVSDGR